MGTEINLMDSEPKPFVIDIEQAAEENVNFRQALCTGTNLQVTLMDLDVGEDIGLEVHTQGDQFILIEQGMGLIQMGDTKDNLNFSKRVFRDYAMIIPTGIWHNLTNIGNVPLKLYAIYAPPQHPRDTIHETKEDDE